MMIRSISVRIWPLTKVTVPGMAELSDALSVWGPRLNDENSETRIAFGGSIVVGWSNAPPRVD